MENSTNNIKEQIKDWAEKTVKAYNSTGLSYYTQSPLNTIMEDHIELLVLGINPGSDSVPFKKWMNNENWKGKVTEDGLSFKYFLEGNPSYVEMRKKERDGTISRKERWRYWDNLCGLLELAGIKNLVDKEHEDFFVLTNIYYGSTKKACEVSDEGFKDLKIYAFKLIDILKPKRIICLGQKVMDAVLDHYIQNKNERSCYVNGLPIRLKKIDNMSVFGFHHPAYYYTTQEKELVGGFLGYYGSNKLPDIDPQNPLPSKELKEYAEAYLNQKANRTNATKGSFDYNELIRLLRIKIKNLDTYKDKDCYRITIGNNNLALTVSPVAKGTIGIRAAHKIDGQWVTEDMETLIPKINQDPKPQWVKYTNNPRTWLAQLQYKGLSEEKIRDTILNTIKILESTQL